MSSKNVIFFLALFFSSTMLAAQNNFNWENRIVYLQTDNPELLQEQIKIFSKNAKALEERKIIIFTKSKNSTYAGLNLEKSPLPKFINKIDGNYFFTLIGLDGGVKFQQNEPMTIDRLNAIIDAMPMRQSELRKKKN